MVLPNDLVSQFVKATNDSKRQKEETIVFGTTVEHDGRTYVRLDGSELLTPVSTTAKTKPDERVTVLIKNHTATITGNVSSPAARTGDVYDLADDIIEVETLIAQKANIDELNVQKGRIDELFVDNAVIKDMIIASGGEFGDLTADYAKINEKLTAVEADINDLKADVADIDILKADVSKIDNLMFGVASGNTIQTTFANTVIAQLGNAQIKSAMIDSVSADKITAGDIITNNVRVKSVDGKLLISDETIQISDDTRVRVQIGKDASNDYSINIWDDAGNLMFSQGGITDKAIKNAIIRNDMVSDTANIAAHKLDIDSLFEEINGSSKTIKSSKVLLDDKNQTLEVAFKSLESNVSSIGDTVTSQGTQISTIQGQISTKVWQQDINSASEEMMTKYSILEQEVDSVSATVVDVENSIDAAEERMTGAESIIQQLSESIMTLVTDSNGESLMVQTENGWTFSTGQIQEMVNNTSENLNSLTDEIGDVNSTVNFLKQAVTDLGVLNDYVKIGTYENEPCIELGESDSDFKLLITNTRIMFMEGSGVPAYVNNQSLYIKKAVVEEELQQGEFVWKARANGNLGLVWKGVTS